MSVFGKLNNGGIFSNLNSSASSQASVGETELTNVPSDTISRLRFSPTSLSETYLMASSWSGDVCCWQVDTSNGTSVHKAQKSHGQSVLDCCWSDDGRYAFTAGTDKIVRGWSLAEDKYIQVASHDAPVKTVNYIKTSTYSVLMTGSWDKTLKFWDLRQADPIKTMDLGERVYCADVCGPMAVVVTADRMVRVLKLEPQPTEFSKTESNLKYQIKCVTAYPRQNEPRGYICGSIEGRVSVTAISPLHSSDTFSFKCHRLPVNAAGFQDVYSVNEIAVNPVHDTIMSVGSDGKFSLWDKQSRTKLKGSDLAKKQPLTCCDIDSTGKFAAFAEGYDWHKGHEGVEPGAKPHIYLRNVFDDMKPKTK